LGTSTLRCEKVLEEADLMDHREASEHLIDLAAGRLDGSTRDAVTRHVESCDDCRAWLEAHDLLASALEAPTEGEHPDSELLALCAVRSEEEFEPDRVGLRSHLEICDRCRHEVELVRAAVLDARPAATPAAAPPPARVFSPRWMYAAAAGIAAAAIGSLLVSGLWQEQTHGLGPTEVVSTSAEAPAVDGFATPPEQFSEAEIEGTRLIETQGDLVISRTKIKDGAQVTIRAGESVAFGNGFQIGQQARIAVGGDPVDPDAKTLEAQNG
jgi:hypothetical protein